ncbi:MAG: sulfatase-like hydrolase/transferase, partial [Phycisphaerae bacterium]|nr:sulfatase-like hydrolase/transferase [Phycisphaerae bacterium]
PNVVLILADDLGWADVGYHGGYIKTPHIDRLAREGVELDRFYVCPMCSPTRASLLTGRYAIRFGLSRAVIPPWRRFGLDTAETTLPQVLAKAGYRHRGIFGKWHLGHHEPKWHPIARGFTHFRGHYNGAIDYFTHEREGQRDWHVDFEPTREDGYTTDLIADAAARFIEQHADEGPFLCYVPFNAPHSPFQALQKYLDRYAHLDAAARGKAGGGKRKTKGPSRERILAAMISSMDDGIGHILAAIDRAGVRENTLIWFMSDNGGIKGVAKNNLPLRGDKLQVFEGGIRVPACVRWPAGFPGGRKLTAPMGCIDVLPTLMAAAGLREHGGKPLDGIDMLGVLRGQTPRVKRDLYFYHGQNGPEKEHLALITPKWKLVILGPDVSRNPAGSPGHQRLLFDIIGDPYEETDLSAKEPETVAAMTHRLVEFRKLQPKDSAPPYGQGRAGFKAPKDWRIPLPPAR